ncbi:hypothetical protein IFT69_06770 [Pseudomonas putida]|nr:hypothetical protein [Pseudomonas putida]
MRLKDDMSRDGSTQVLVVKQYRKADSLVLNDASHSASSAAAVEGRSNAGPSIAGGDLCLVRLLIGPGNPGPEQRRVMYVVSSGSQRHTNRAGTRQTKPNFI